MRRLALIAMLAVASPLAAQTITDPTAPPAAAKPAAPDRQPSSFTFTAAYTADALDNLSGGVSRGANYVDLLRLSADYDGAGAGHDGLTALISIDHFNGSNFTGERVGGVQSASGSEAQPSALRLDEAWIQQEFWGGAGALKAGFIEINTTFDVQETAALFLNASHGVGPDLGDTGLNGPSDYPTSALAIATVYRPAPGWTAQLGLFDAVAGDPNHRRRFVAVQLSARDGALIIAQIEKRFGDTARVEAGAWTYTASFPSLVEMDANGVPRRIGGNAGVYGLVEGRLMSKSGDDAGGLSGWLRVGLANGNINRVETYLGAGLVYTGAIRGRDKDEMGVAIASVGLGDGARSAGALQGLVIGGSETVFEATYRCAFKDWLNVQPDAQYIINPGGNRRLGNALVVGVRFAFTASR